MKSAPFRKKLWHHFLLLQPILQFLTLLAVLVVLSRCSPLASSEQKAGPKNTSPSASGNVTDSAKATPENVERIADEELLTQSLVEVPSSDAVVTVEKDFNQNMTQGLEIATQEIKAPKKRILPVALWKLNRMQIAVLANKGRVFVNARALMDKLDSEPRAQLLAHLQQSLQAQTLRAQLFVVADGKNDLGDQHVEKIPLQISLSILDENRALLAVRREKANSDGAEALEALQQVALRNAKFLAVVLYE